MSRRIARPRAIATVAIALGLALSGAFAFWRALDADEPVVGIEWLQSAGGPIALTIDPAGPAWLAGVRPGDVLREIDGRVVRSAVEAAEAPWRSPDALRYRLSRNGEIREFVVQPIRAVRSEPYGYLALVGWAFLISGAFVAWRWTSVRGGMTYAIFAAAMFVRCVFRATGEADAFDAFVSAIDTVAGFAVPALLLHLAFDLGRRRLRPVLATATYGPPVAALAFAAWLHPAILGGAYRFEDPIRAVEWIDRVAMTWFCVALPIAAAVLGRAYGGARSVLQRGQVRWAQWGFVLGFAPFVALHGLPWALGAEQFPSWIRFLAVAPMLIVPAALTAALARYRLYDLDLLLRRAATEVSAVILTIAVYAAAVNLLRHGLSDLFELSRSATRYVGMLLAVLSYPQTRVWMRGAIDRAFYRKRYSFRATMQDWSRELAAEVDLSSLLGNLGERVVQTLGVPGAATYVVAADGRFVDPLAPGNDGAVLTLDEALKRRLETEPFATVPDGPTATFDGPTYLFGMKVKGRLRAVLAIAERTAPADPLSSEDHALLATLSSQAASAIDAARLLHELRQQTEEMRRSHARERTILETSAVGLLVLDGQRKVRGWNRALERIYGAERHEAIGRALGDVFPWHFVRYLEGRLEGDDPDGRDGRALRYTLRDREGRRRVINLSVAAAEDGATTVVTFDDVTQRVELEQQLMRQDRLASLGLLAAGVAHEVNTPLTGISSYAQMLTEQLSGDDPGREILAKIEEQTQRASDIANSLLDLARPDRDGAETVDLNDVVSRALGLFDVQIRGRDLTVDVALADGLPPVSGHPGKLQQVLLNLLLNARDATPRGGRVAVRTSEHRGRVLLDVVDDGEGIEPADLARVFDPFFTTKGRGRGTGLGLSISYGIVREHGGEILVDTDAGNGTRFRVSLPATGAAQAAG